LRAFLPRLRAPTLGVWNKNHLSCKGLEQYFLYQITLGQRRFTWLNAREFECRTIPYFNTLKKLDLKLDNNLFLRKKLQKSVGGEIFLPCFNLQ